MKTRWPFLLGDDMFRVSVEVKLPGLNAIDKAFTTGNSPHITAMLTQWAARYRGFAQKRFDAYSKGGGNWPPLAEQTIANRRTGKKQKLPLLRRKKMKPIKPVSRARTAKLNIQVQKARLAVSKAKNTFARRKAMNRLKALKQKYQHAKRAKARKQHNENEKHRLGLAKQNRKVMLANRRVAILRDTNTLFAALNPVFTNKPGAIERKSGITVLVGYGGPNRYTGKGTSASIADVARFHNDGVGHLPVRKIIVPPTPDVVTAMAGDAQRAADRITRESNQ